MNSKINGFVYIVLFILILSGSQGIVKADPFMMSDRKIRVSYNSDLSSDENGVNSYLPYISRSKPDELAQTTLASAVKAGENTLTVSSTAGFGFGDRVKINPGNATEEEGIIVGFGSLTLEKGLKYNHNPGEVVVDLEVILIKAGEFQMGCDPVTQFPIPCNQSELPLHTVYLDAYFIDKYEVTNAKYERCVAAHACWGPSATGSETRASYFGNPTFDNYPVVTVTWTMANEFCKAAGKRLPTEAEWERAARGNIDTRPWPWGGSAPDCGKANYNYMLPDLTYYSCVGDTTPVGSYSARGHSPDGVMDMAGNALEWVNDYFQSDYYSVSPYRNPQGPEYSLIKIARGGAFRINFPDHGKHIRVTQRYAWYWPEEWAGILGFRCADSP